MKEKILVFDFDGVIADSLAEVWAYYKKNYGKYGLPPFKSVEDFTSLYDRNFFKSIIKLGISPLKLKELAKDLIYVVGERYKYIKIFPGMKSVMKKLGEKHKIIVISSNFNRPIKIFLERYKIGVDRVIGADEEESKIAKIKMVKGEFPNAELIYIGDTAGDVIEGRKAGVKVTGVTWGFHSKKKIVASKPDFIANRPSDLLKIVQDR